MSDFMDPVTAHNYQATIHALHKDWDPHEAQVKVGSKLFLYDVRRLFIQCGRKWGKTELILYILWRWASLNPGANCYYISPFYKQSKEIIWANKRVQSFGPVEFLLPGSSGINNSELRLNLRNGSFIKLDGSDNHEAYRGINPHLIVYEEFKDFHPEFHIAMNPNLSSYDAPLVIIGTPPEAECQYTELAQEFEEEEGSFFYKGPTWENPHIDKVWLEKEKSRLYRRGEHDVWWREYGAEFIVGGSSSIFPMFDRDSVVDHSTLVGELKREWNRLEFGLIADPGTASVTGVLFYAYNRYTSKFYLLDEIYITKQRENTVNLIGAAIGEKKLELNQRADWGQVCDEAATWFMNEMSDRFDEGYTPTQKSLAKKEHGLSLIKDMMLSGYLVVSSRCVKFVWEVQNYVKDRNGKIPKKNDHLIDCLRYGLDYCSYSLNEEKIEISAVDAWAEREGRGIKIEDDNMFSDRIIDVYEREEI